jgi:hypothetical protein
VPRVRDHRAREGFAAEAFGEATLPLNGPTETCTRTLYTFGRKMIGSILKVNRSCQRRAHQPNACPTFELRDRERILNARRKLEIAAAARAREQTSRRSAPVPPTFRLGCVLDAARNYGELLAYDASRLQLRRYPHRRRSSRRQLPAGSIRAAFRTDGSVFCWGNDDFQRPAVVATAGSVHADRGGESAPRAASDPMGRWTAGARRLPPVGAARRNVQRSVGRLAAWVRNPHRRTLACWGGVRHTSSSAAGDVHGDRFGTATQLWRSSRRHYRVLGLDFRGLRAVVSAPWCIYGSGCERDYNCGLHTDGTIECWGNVFGSSPPPCRYVRIICIRLASQCALRADGTAPWLGDKHSPWRIERAGRARSHHLRSENRHTLGCTSTIDGNCWETIRMDRRRLRRSAASSSPIPGLRLVISIYAAEFAWTAPSLLGRRVACATPGTFAQLSAADSLRCAVANDGTLACWGDDDYGQLRPPPETFLEVSAGALNACALPPDNRTCSWGIRSVLESLLRRRARFVHVSVGSLVGCAVTNGRHARRAVAKPHHQCVAPARHFPWRGGPDPSIHAPFARTGRFSAGARNESGDRSPGGNVSRPFSVDGLRHSCGLRTDGRSTAGAAIFPDGVPSDRAFRQRVKPSEHELRRDIAGPRSAGAR